MDFPVLELGLGLVCWGCGKDEDKNMAFKRCRLCIKESRAPARFCSLQCATVSWSIHVKWHKQQLQHPPKCFTSEHALVRPSTRKVNADKNRLEICRWRAIYYMSKAEFAKEAKYLIKAIKCDPSNPEAVVALAESHWSSGHPPKIYIPVLTRCLEMIAQRLYLKVTSWVMQQPKIEGFSQTLPVLAGFDGFDDSFMYVLADIVWTIFTGDPDPRSSITYLLPKWFLNDKLLKEILIRLYPITKFRSRFVRAELDLLIANNLSGELSVGKFTNLTKGIFPMPERTKDEIQQAVQIYEMLLNTHPDLFPTSILALYEHNFTNGTFRDYIKKLIAICKTRLESMPPDPCHSAQSKLYVGCWVVIKGLKSAKGSAMNGKVGSVKGYLNANGRVPVEIKETGGSIAPAKLFKPENITVIELEETGSMLVHCMNQDAISPVFIVMSSDDYLRNARECRFY